MNNNVEHFTDLSHFSAALAWLDRLAEQHFLLPLPFDQLELSKDQRRRVSKGRYIDLVTGETKEQARILAIGEVTVLVRARQCVDGDQFMVDLFAPDLPEEHYQNLFCRSWELELLLLLYVN